MKKKIIKFLEFLLNNFYIKIAGIILSIISLFYALYIANSYGSMDFQYSPTILFYEKINPYDYFLYSKTIERLYPVQYPVYAHATYILFFPFAYLDWSSAKLLWSIINTLLGFIIVLFLCQKSKINFFDTCFILSLFFLSVPFRNCVGNGQITFVILASFCFLLLKRTELKSFFLGLSYIKYSFAPILSAVIYFKYGIKNFTISGLIIFIGWILFSTYLEQNIFYTAMQPIQAGLKGFDAGLARGDLFTILNFFKNLYIDINIYIIIALIIIFNIYIAKKISKINDNFLLLSLILIGTLLSFGHLMYDYIVLLPMLVYSFKNKNNLNSKISILIIFYFWFGIRIFEYVKMLIFNISVITPSIIDVIINFILLSTLFLINFKNGNYFNKFNLIKKIL